MLKLSRQDLYWLATICALVGVLALLVIASRPAPIVKSGPKDVALMIEKLKAFSSQCGYVAKLKSTQNPPTKFVIVIGEYHAPDDVQRDIACLLHEFSVDYPVGVIGTEGLKYNSKHGKDFTDVTLIKARIPENIPVIGLEKFSPYRSPEFAALDAIDNRHAQLAKKKFSRGLTTAEELEYNHVGWQSYTQIVRARSFDWVSNVSDFMRHHKLTTGIIRSGMGHFWTVGEALEERGVSYAWIVPTHADDYVLCETYFVLKHKTNRTDSNKATCENQNIPSR